MLQRKEIALLDPASWEDRNDAYYLDLFRAKNAFTSVFALCMTRASTTFHHWKIFSGSTSGVCLHFNYDQLVLWATANQIQLRSVEYFSLQKARRIPPSKLDLPFRKRHAFKDEAELRLLHASHEQQRSSKAFSFKLSMLEKIQINPWLPEGAFNAVSESIREIEDCRSLAVEQSHLLNNREWATIAINAK
jgi:hypothetical protein